MTDKRIVITGIGPAGAIGLGRAAFQAGLAAARSAISEVTLLDTEGTGSSMAAEVPPFAVEEYVLTPKTYLDRAAELAFAAMKLAVEDGGLNPVSLEDTRRIGLALGTATGDQATAETFFEGLLAKGPRLVKPLLFPHAYSNTAASLLAVEYNLKGPHWNFADGFTAAASALVQACDAIALGKADAVFAGGVEALSNTLFEGFAMNGMLSPGGVDGGDEGCAPFDRGRNGFVLGEGAAIALFERSDHAAHRQARVYAEVAGVGMAAAPQAGVSAEAVTRAMQTAMAAADVSPGSLDMVLAHANGSVESDACEAEALSAVCPGVPVTSVKPLLGETVGAGGAFQLLAALAAIQNKSIPPILNVTQAADWPNLCVVAGVPVDKPVSLVMVNTIDPGGNAVSLIIREPQGV